MVLLELGFLSFIVRMGKYHREMQDACCFVEMEDVDDADRLRCNMNRAVAPVGGSNISHMSAEQLWRIYAEQLYMCCF